MSGELAFSRTLVASFLEEVGYVTRIVLFFFNLGETLYLARKNKEVAGLLQSFALGLLPLNNIWVERSLIISVPDVNLGGVMNA